MIYRLHSFLNNSILSFLLSVFILLFFTGGTSNDKESGFLVYKFSIREQIAHPVWRITQKSFKEAHDLGADLIIIHMNTYGGMVDFADSIRTKILNSTIPVYVFIDDNAASAGALISIACDSIYMRPGAKFGAATVVNQTGDVVPDKFQSYMRATMRATAEAHGKDTIITGRDTIIRWKRDPKIAESMVDPVISIPGIVDSGKVLTFTAEEALKNGYCEGLANNIQEILKQAGIEKYELAEFKPTTLDNIIGFLLNPIVHGLLIIMIIGGIYYELQSPGIGFPLSLAVLGAVLYFAPLYLEGLAQNWEIAVFILGVILLIIEIFAIPGFGVTGIAGVILIITGLTMAMVDNLVFEPGNFPEALNAVLKAFLIVVVSVFISILISLLFIGKLADSPVFSKIALDSVQKTEEGFTSADNLMKGLIGKEGIAHSVLRPSGKVLIEGEVYDAKSEYGYIDKGEKIKVFRYEAGQLYVEKL